MPHSERSATIATLNDQFRKTGVGGQIVITTGIEAYSVYEKTQIFQAIQQFDQFTQENDPYGEHDFGKVTAPDGQAVFWKIDYYDSQTEYGSPDPSDPAKTQRVMTVLLADEY